MFDVKKWVVFVTVGFKNELNNGASDVSRTRGMFCECLQQM